MTYDEALAFWYGRIDYERRPARPGDLKLDRMRALLARLHGPQGRFRVVHVAGSKGKGSTAVMLAEVLRRAGYRTGLFTSPHLVDVRERIQVDGVPIGRDELAARMAEVAPAVRAVERPDGPTFFEVGTALGFLHFERRRVDVAVVEVGLGGRFDSTNVVRPAVSVITSIGYDHTQILGDKLSSIAREKAGIVKPGRPTVSGATAPEARAVIDAICAQRRSPLRQLGRDFVYEYEPGRVSADGGPWLFPRVAVGTRGRRWPAMDLGLLGEHQAANAAVAVATVEVLREQGLTVPDAAVAAGLAGVRWPARLEVLGYRPLLVLDCAHNVSSAQALVDTLRESFPPAGRRVLVLAVSADKDVPGILRVLAPHFHQAILTRFANNPRPVPPEQLADWLREIAPNLPAVTAATAADAWRAARQAAGADDLICVTGSVFLAGELRPVLVPS